MVTAGGEGENLVVMFLRSVSRSAASLPPRQCDIFNTALTHLERTELAALQTAPYSTYSALLLTRANRGIGCQGRSIKYTLRVSRDWRKPGDPQGMRIF